MNDQFKAIWFSPRRSLRVEASVRKLIMEYLTVAPKPIEIKFLSPTEHELEKQIKTLEDALLKADRGLQNMDGCQVSMCPHCAIIVSDTRKEIVPIIEGIEK